MDAKLFGQGIIKFVSGIVIIGIILFVPAGSFGFWQGWLLMGILFVPMFVAGLIMMKRSPDLLRKRLNAKEEQPEQKTVLFLSGFMFIVAFVVAGLNFRFGWLTLPNWIPILFAVVFLLAYTLYAEVMRENVYLSRTVEVQENQQVVDTGLYGIVRHPMYMTTLLLFLSMPLVLGSLISFLIMFLYLPIIAKRMHNEEQVLAEGLPGYAEYMKKVKYRVIPFIW